MTRAKKVKPVTVKELVDRGIPIRDAVRCVLAGRHETLASWCRSIGYHRSAASRLLGGGDVMYDDLRDALCRSFGLSRKWLDEHLAGLEG